MVAKIIYEISLNIRNFSEPTERYKRRVRFQRISSPDHEEQRVVTYYHDVDSFSEGEFNDEMRMSKPKRCYRFRQPPNTSSDDEAIIISSSNDDEVMKQLSSRAKKKKSERNLVKRKPSAKKLKTA